MKKLDSMIAGVLGRGVRKMICCLPWNRLNGLGAGAGRAGYFISREKRAIALSNLETAFGGKMKEPRAREVAIKSFENMGRSLCEVFAAAKLGPSGLKEIISVEGVENLAKAAGGGRGVIGFSAHLGNFALLGPRLALEGYGFNYILRFPESSRLNAYARMFAGNITYLAGLLGVGLISANGRKESVKQSLRSLRSEEIVCILGDQNKVDGVWIDFFGKPAGTADGPVVLAMRTGASIVPMFARRNWDGRQTVVVEPEFELDITGDYGRDVLFNTERLARIVESLVSAQPEQWWWIQRRWKAAGRRNVS